MIKDFCKVKKFRQEVRLSLIALFGRNEMSILQPHVQCMTMYAHKTGGRGMSKKVSVFDYVLNGRPKVLNFLKVRVSRSSEFLCGDS